MHGPIAMSIGGMNASNAELRPYVSPEQQLARILEVIEISRAESTKQKDDIIKAISTSAENLSHLR